MLTNRRNVPCGIEFVRWLIMSLVITAENDCHDVVQPQVAVHRSCHRF